MKTFPLFMVWAALLALVAAEFLAARFDATRLATPILGIMMALLVAFTIMQLGTSRGLVPIFALAGFFWLCVMLGMGSLDSFTRHDIAVSPVPQAPR